MNGISISRRDERRIGSVSDVEPIPAAARRRPFWTAIMSGLAAPTMMFAPPPAYASMRRDFGVGASFASVGNMLTECMREHDKP